MNEKREIQFGPVDQKRGGSSVGSLQGEVWLSVQTYQAQSLVRGRRSTEGKPAIMGLLGFAVQLNTLWQAVRMDDPYADWWLIKIEAAIALCREHLSYLLEELSALLESHSSFQISIAESSKPQRISLQFANPYAFRGAQMLADYDRLMCLVMTVRHLGIGIPQDLNEQVDASARRLRSVFALPQGYHCCDIDRIAVMQGGQLGRNARERMGEVPEDILCGDRLPALRPVPFRAPLVVVSPSASSEGSQVNLESTYDTNPDAP